MVSESDFGASVMRQVAAKATMAAKKVMIEEIERMLPEDKDPRNGGRQIGAMITAASMLYGAMLDTVASEGDKGQAILAAGMLKHFCAGGLSEIAELAGVTGGVAVIGTGKY